MSSDLTLAKKLIKECQETQNPELDLSNCGIEDLNDLPELFECTHLESLNLSSVWLTKSNKEPKWSHNINKGTANTFNTVPLRIASLKGLKKLIVCGLEGKKLRSIRFLEDLTEIEVLDISFNEIWDTRFLRNLTKLIDLNLSNNIIWDIDVVENLAGLNTLNLSYNEIRKIIPLKNLSNLTNLNLSSNQISDIRFLENLKHLKSLDLRRNNIKMISLPIFHLNMEIKLGEHDTGGLCLHDNLISSPPLEIIRQGKQSVFAWFEAKKKKLNEIKIILIGDPKAGKTSLLRKLKTNEFDENEVQTDGINIEDIQFGECKTFEKQQSLQKLTAHFWDFGGQEIMNATHQFFLTNRSIYILVLDARKDANVSTQIRTWVKRIKATSGKSPIVIVANQADVNPGFGFANEFELKEEFPEIKHFIKVSCKTGEGVEFIKQRLEELIPKAELFNTSIDERWIHIKEQLQEETKSKNFLDEERFIKICNSHGLTEKSARTNAINFLNDLGLVLHFEDLNLAEYYVLDPYWITYGVYQIVTSAYAGEQKGIISMDMLDFIVNEEEDKKAVYKPTKFRKIIYDSPNQRRFLVDILNQFKLCFYLDDHFHFIIPDLIDTSEPADITEPIRKAVDSIHFVFRYDYLPKSIMPYILVETHPIIKRMWRTGCVLIDNDCSALISTYQDLLTITVTGQHKKKVEFMAVIRHLINGINQKLTDKPKMLIPLPGIFPNAYAEYEVLLNRERKGRTDFIFDEDKPTEKSFEISQLLEGIATPDEIKEINQKLDKIQRGVGAIIEKLDEHYQYLIAKLADDKINDEIIEAIKELNETQTTEITDEILKQIATAFDLFSGDEDERFEKIYHDLKKTDNLEAKLKLSVPFINVLGIDLGLEAKFDIKRWATKMYDKYQLQIFKLMGAV